MITFQLTWADENGSCMTAMTTADGEVHPDLLDELSTRCLVLFTEANASFDQADDADA